jgi:hypothetical protein
MANEYFDIKQGDLLPTLDAILKDDNGPVDMTGSTLKFFMRTPEGTVKVNGSAATADPNQVVNKGKVSYAWSGTDTDTPGMYQGEFEATINSKRETFPSHGYIVITVVDDIG